MITRQQQRAYSDVTQMECHPLRPVGLENLGNTCYMNCCIQLLMSSVILSKEIGKLRLSQIRQTQLLRRFMLMKIVGKPDEFRQQMVDVYDDYAGYRQQDCNECFMRVLEVWEKELRVTSRAIPPNPAMVASIPPGDLLKHFSLFSWRMHTLTMPTLCKIFYGQIRSLITCRSCKQEKNSFIPFSSLSLLGQSDVIVGLEAYQSTEYLDGYDCEVCQRKTRIRKKHLLWKLPKVLVLQCPMKDLTFLHENISVNDQLKKKNYTLRSVGCHSGQDINSGHYYAYAKYRQRDNHNIWFSVSDESVKSSHFQKLLGRCGDVYMLCYERV